MSSSFDESLNEVTQTSEMDLYVRFWDVNANRVKNRYFGSSFLGHTTSKDLLTHFNDVVKDLEPSKLYQISMDGPNVNLKFFDDFSRSFAENNLHSLVNIGVCSLHVVHGSLKSGEEITQWGLKKILSSAYRILHDSPARREDYNSVTGSSLYPFKFCSTR